jgi:hypothetical protein
MRRVLFDQGVPLPLRRELPDAEVSTAFQMGWSRVANGDLLTAAEAGGFEVFITTDQNLRYQQNLAARQIGILVLPTTDWREIRQHVEEVREALAGRCC